MKAPKEFGVSDADMAEIAIPNDLRSAKAPEDRILDQLQRCQYDADTIFAVKLALEEALTNAVKHGNQNDGSKCVLVRFHVDPARAVIMVRDQGRGFCPQDVPDCTRDENLERPNGRGIMLMHAYMTSVCFNSAGNEVWMLKRNPKAPPPAAGRSPSATP
ncbi:MAG TPA: ATP-binding protein [Phycisphaerae bacterium]|nr:ATP-binding protein [Phycisphaerae bacterium]